MPQHQSLSAYGAAWTDTLPLDDDRFQEDHGKVWGSGPGDVWAVGSFGALSHWDGARWKELPSAKQPPTFQDAAVAYDAARGRAVLFGGSKEGDFVYYDWTWAWDGEDWSEIATATA